MKVLFIDLDDVFILHVGENQAPRSPFDLGSSFESLLNSMTFYSQHFNPSCLENLKELIKLNVKIIIHSSWVRYWDLSQFQAAFKAYGIDENAFLGTIPVINGNLKVNGIKAILEQNKAILDYAIIDDDSSLKNLPNFVLINKESGFDAKALLEVKKLLKL